MSRKDYTRFSNAKEPVNDVVIQNGVTIPLEEEVVVEEETTNVVEAVPETIEVIGVVIDCSKLNIRKSPNPYAEVVGTIDVGSEVTIDEAESSNEFYKICTAAGAEGFCMKKFIRVE